jgi:hypothetical protein
MFLALNSLPGKSYGGNLPGAMGIFQPVVNNFMWIFLSNTLASGRVEVFFIPVYGRFERHSTQHSADHGIRRG